MLTSGSPAGLSSGVSGKIFSYIKFLNISYSEELEQALKYWNSDFFSLGFSIELSTHSISRFQNQTVPYMLEKYDVPSSFFVNFWPSFLVLIITTGIFLFLWSIIWALKRLKLRKDIITLFETIPVMVQNFLVTQLYGIFGDIVFYSILEWRSIRLSQGLSSLSFVTALIFFCVMFACFSFHIRFIRQYRKIQRRNESLESKEDLIRFKNKYKGFQLIFRDFKDLTKAQQAFLLFLAIRDIIFSLIIVTLFEHPLAQTILILLLDIVMIVYLFVQRPFREFLDEIQQFFYEFVILGVNVSVLILSIFDTSDIRDIKVRNNICRAIMITNMCFNFATIGFLLLKLVLLAKGVYIAYRTRRSKLTRKPININNVSMSTSRNVLSLTTEDITKSFSQTKEDDSKITEINSQQNRVNISQLGLLKNNKFQNGKVFPIVNKFNNELTISNDESEITKDFPPEKNTRESILNLKSHRFKPLEINSGRSRIEEVTSKLKMSMTGKEIQRENSEPNSISFAFSNNHTSQVLKERIKKGFNQPWTEGSSMRYALNLSKPTEDNFEVVDLQNSHNE